MVSYTTQNRKASNTNFSLDMIDCVTGNWSHWMWIFPVPSMVNESIMSCKCVVSLCGLADMYRVSDNNLECHWIQQTAGTKRASLTMQSAVVMAGSCPASNPSSGTGQQLSYPRQDKGHGSTVDSTQLCCLRYRFGEIVFETKQIILQGEKHQTYVHTVVCAWWKNTIFMIKKKKKSTLPRLDCHTPHKNLPL